MRLLIGADIVPTMSNEALFRLGAIDKLIGKELKDKIDSADYVILNLETPITDETSPIVKAGLNLVAPSITINGLKKINPYFFGICNNHILDQDEQGLFSTIKLFRENEISYAGAGKTPEEASKPFITEVAGVRMGIYLCTEHEYSIVSDKNAGANPYDPLYSFDHVKELREKCDLCIVLFHGGREHYRYPTPQLQRVFRKFAEVGADVVIAQHTHCIGCKEEYNGSLLLYGQGNFLFDNSDADTEKTSLLLQINTEGKMHHFSFIPIVKNNFGVRLAKKKKSEEILSAFEDRSKVIAEPGMVEKLFEKYAKTQARGYFAGISGGFGKILPIRVLNKFLKYRLSEKMYSGTKVLALDNFINCETHREIVQEVCKIKKEII